MSVRNTNGTYSFCYLGCLLVATVEELLVLIHPDFCQSYLVPGNHLCTFGKGVGTFCAENMTNNGARDDLQLSTTLPHLWETT